MMAKLLTSPLGPARRECRRCTSRIWATSCAVGCLQRCPLLLQELRLLLLRLRLLLLLGLRLILLLRLRLLLVLGLRLILLLRLWLMMLLLRRCRADTNR